MLNGKPGPGLRRFYWCRRRAGGVAGEGRADGDLVHVAAVKDLDVEHGQQDFARP